ncbi:MAG: ABC transporter permease [Solirubrobacteraceae bacterium]|jgi:ABC-type multidrug transport system permease subunit
MRWLALKDLQILRRSRLLVALLVVYPVAIALMIGFALSSPPGKPKVAYYSGVAPGQGALRFGDQTIDISKDAAQLLESIDPIRVSSPAQAIAKVRAGDALAALIVPAAIVPEVQSLVTQGVGNPTVQLVLNSSDPLERQYVQQAIATQLDTVEQAISKQVLRVAVGDLQRVLDGGTVQLLGQSVALLGLHDTRTIVEGTIASLPARSPLAPALRQVASFANLAIDGLAFASPVLGSIGTPLTVQQTELAGKTTPSASYAVAIAVVVSLMFVAVLLAAGMLAMERSENAYRRLVRGLVAPTALLAEKIALSAAAAAVVALLMAAFVSLFVHLQWARFELWVAALALGALAFGALGVAIGAVAREVGVASLLAFSLALPVAFVALVPAAAVSGSVKTVLDAVAFVFPFKAALQAAANAFSATGPSIGGPLVHLAALTVLFAALARLALRRFAR